MLPINYTTMNQTNASATAKPLGHVSSTNNLGAAEQLRASRDMAEGLYLEDMEYLYWKSYHELEKVFKN